MAGTGQAPKMEALFTALKSEGYAAARVPDIDPFLVTDAPFATVMACVVRLTQDSACGSPQV